MLAFLGHPRLVFRPVHPLPQLIHIGEHVLLLLAEAIEPIPRGLAVLLRLRLLERGLEFLEAVVQILLPLGQFLETVDDLQLLLLFRGLLRGGFPLVFVTVVGLFQVQLAGLALTALALLTPLPALPALLGDVEFAGLQLEHRLQGGLLIGQGRGQRGQGIVDGRIAQLGAGLDHGFFRGVHIGLDFGIQRLRLHLAHLVQCVLL